MLELAGGGWSARLLPAQGGALAALRWRGEDVLVPLPAGADPTRSFAGAFLLLPWANRLDGGRFGADRLAVNRPEDDTAIHGLSRDRPWDVAEAGPARAVLTQRVTLAPFDYAARCAVTVGDTGFELALSVTNLGAAPCRYGLGWHPFFRRPAGIYLEVAARERLLADARNLPIGAEPSTGIHGTAAGWIGLDHCFAGWDGTARFGWPGLALTLAAQGAWAGQLQVFTPPGAEVVCLEPVSHIPDAPNRPALAALGPMAVLAPGATLAARLRLAVAP